MTNQKNRKLNRLKHFDYSAEGFYFVTICTKNMQHFFGEIENGEMKLNNFGSVGKYYWKEIPNYFTCCILDQYIIMPNHIHGILGIKSKISENLLGNSHGHSLRNQHSLRIKMKLSNAINGFKSSVTRIIRQKFKNYEFGWQKSFYDHIVRNDRDLSRIREYITQNPTNWELEKG